MKKSSLITSVVATAGVIVAGALSGAAVINAASTTAAEVTQTSQPEAAQLPAAAPLSLSPSPSIASITRHAVEKTSGVSAARAAASAVAAADGTVLAVSKASHGGYRSWAVRIQRTDGSVLTGYVDRSTGTVYDWVVNHSAPDSVQGSNAHQGGGSDEDNEQEKHEEDDD